MLVNPTLKPLTAAEMGEIRPRLPGPMKLGDLIAELQKLEQIYGSEIPTWNESDGNEVYSAYFQNEKYDRRQSKHLPNRITIC